MTEPIPDWFLAFFVFVLLILVGIAYQLHRIEKKLNWIWKWSKEPDERD